MGRLGNIMFAAALCVTVNAVRAQEPVRKPDLGTGVRDVLPGSEPYSGGTSVSRKPFTTLPVEVRRQPDAIADTLMRRVAPAFLRTVILPPCRARARISHATFSSTTTLPAAT